MGNIKDSRYDISTRKGELAEKLVIRILTDKTIEVKNDGQWVKTGNLFVEMWCWQQLSQSWKKSGLLITESDYYAFVIEGAILHFPTSVVMETCKRFGKQGKCDIPPNPSKGYLVTVNELLTVLAGR